MSNLRAYPRAVILYLILINMIFIGPIFLFLSDRGKEALEVFYDILPFYFTFLILLIIAFTVHRKGVDTNVLLNKFTGPTKIVRTYFNIFVKGKRVTLLWLLFWFSVIALGIKAIKAVVF